jgi:hypothetical protein
MKTARRIQGSRFLVQGMSAAALFLAGCQGTAIGGNTSGSAADVGCTASNCDVLSSCGLALEGEPRALPVCGVLGNAVDSYCVKACEASGAGAILDCVASQFAEACAAASPPPPSEIRAACIGDAGPCGANCMTCQDGCQAAWIACNLGCGDAGVCLDCEYQCSQAQVRCDQLCPTD